MKKRINTWITAARLRTLPLAVSTMILGHTLAAYHGKFNWSIAILSILTAVSLQILSNLSNDYGDSIHGADHQARTGPKRVVQSGEISADAMKNGIYLLAFISLTLGVVLIYIAFNTWMLRSIFLILGLSAIWAAINYTAGSKPYGYSGKGDIAVFIFFGGVTVLGSFFLQTQSLYWALGLPSYTCGALSVGVLNVNNIRDIISDEQAGKRSIPVIIGRKSAIIYHALLLSSSFAALIAFALSISFQELIQWVFLLTIPLFIINYRAVSRITDAVSLDPYLKQLALSTSLLILLFCAGLLL